MLAMKNVRTQLGVLLAADATTLAPATLVNNIALIALAFSLSEGIVIGDLTLATFTGSTPLGGAVGGQQVGNDPLTGEQVVTIKEPLGGWRWICTTAPALPETIFGYALLDNANAVVLGVAVLPVPITITSVNDEINLGAVKLRVNLQPLT
jgi:hypothetical protein